MKNKQTFLNILIFVLLVGVLVEGYFLFNNTKKENPENNQEAVDSQRVGVNVLDFPGPDASEEERQAHFELAQRVAVEADAIDITDCRPDPVVLRTFTGQPVNIINKNNATHVITFGPEERYTIQPESEVALELEFSQGEGLYGYNCDGSLLPIGIIIVAPAGN